MKNNTLRSKFIKTIATALEEYGLTPINGWIEGVLTIEDRGLTQKEISEKLSEILSEDHFATSLTSVNRGLKSMERNNLIIKEGSRKAGYKYTLNTISGIPIGFFEKILSVNIIHLESMQKLKSEISKANDSSLSNAVEMQITFSKTIITFFQKLIDEIKENNS